MDGALVSFKLVFPPTHTIDRHRKFDLFVVFHLRLYPCSDYSILHLSADVHYYIYICLISIDFKIVLWLTV